MTEPTKEEREAVEKFVSLTLTPLIESVLVKKLTQAAVFCRDELRKDTKPTSHGKTFVLVEAYTECGEYTDDNPGLRADCARKLREGKPCEKCPTRAKCPLGFTGEHRSICSAGSCTYCLVNRGLF